MKKTQVLLRKGMIILAEKRKTYPYPVDIVYTTMLNVFQSNRYTIKSSDEKAKIIKAKSGITLTSFGEAISVRITPNGADSCEVIVSSSPVAPTFADSSNSKVYVESASKVLYLLSDALQKLQYHPIYHVSGSFGQAIDVYENKCVITRKVSLGSLVTGGFTNGEKTIYYVDCVGVQFKRYGTGLTNGYLQLETSTSFSKGKASNFVNENTFIITSEEQNEQCKEIADYIKEKIEEVKQQKSMSQTTTVVQQTSVADEIKKFKELLDMGVITQEEFDAKKKQLLGL